MPTGTLDPVEVLRSIKDVGEATAAEVGTTRAYLNELAQDGFVVQSDVRKTGHRGRPAATFKLTKKGADKVRRSSK